jgi:uncharacterized protein YdhG (YjbR/CyaY superfamily)
MKTNPIPPTSIDEYIAGFQPDVQALLKKMRATIRNVAPDAEETISYQMPTFRLHDNLVHFAAFKQHVGFYPTPSGIENFSNELAGYKTSKGAIQFPLDKPIPFNLISEIVKFRVQENVERMERKMKKGKGKE